MTGQETTLVISNEIDSNTYLNIDLESLLLSE